MNIQKKSFQKKFEILILVFCIVISAVFMTICNKSSPIYPLQDGVSPNCFHTVGKQIVEGNVLYRDTFEQKGPATYFLYAFLYLVFGNSFFGSFLADIISFSFFLYIASKCIRLYSRNAYHIFYLLPILAFSITVSPAFGNGGSVEGLSLAGLLLIIYSLLKTIKFGTVSKLEYILNGIYMGFIFWVKYTMTGIYIGAFLFIFVFLLIKKKYKELINIFLFSFLGFVIATLPILIYFAVNGAMYDLFYVYFYKNMFSYSYDTSIFSRLMSVVRGPAGAVVKNIFIGILAVLGLAWALTKKNAETLLLLACAIMWAVGTYIGVVRFVYYGLTLSVFSVFGLVAVSVVLDRLSEKIKSKKIKSKQICAMAAAVICVVLSVGSFFISPNTYLLKYDKEDLPQYIFAEKISEVEDATLLNYGFLDGGFYYAADITPPFKYFCKLNVRSEEMDSEMDRYVTEAIPDFVVTRDHTLDEFFDEHGYTCVESADLYFEGDTKTYYLYQKNPSQ